jgi:hypothetical protein
MKIISPIINRPILLNWNSTHKVNSVTALETLISAYPFPTNLCSRGDGTAHLKAIAHVPPNLLYIWCKIGLEDCMVTNVVRIFGKE